ncbi:MAG TPA: GNAT family N-acetyltransferase [Caulobacteraceae bacterium]|nr:GNAT family N-acetyltransferase [Caulobacteraceae bacterium]
MSLILVPASDAHLAWMVGEGAAPDGLALPPGGVDTPPILQWVRRTLPKLGGYGSWLMVDDGEVVGLGGYKWAPSAAGEVEIGYGVAPARRRRGYAGQASRLMLEAARADARLSALVAETAMGNLASQRVLAGAGFFKVGRGWDDEEGETIRWRLELRDAPDAPVPPGLIAQRFDALYETADGNIVRSNSFEARPAPRFHLMLSAEGPMIRFRGDVPDDVRRRLEDLAAAETWDPDHVGPPATFPAYVGALAPHGPVQATWAGPAFAMLRDIHPWGPVVEMTASNAGLLTGKLAEWLPDIGHRQPFVAVVHDAMAVSLCASVRISPAVHCAGVETHPGHRRRGHALAAVSGWAHAVQRLGATPFYSTAWENRASRAVAARLRFQPVATDFHVS